MVKRKKFREAGETRGTSKRGHFTKGKGLCLVTKHALGKKNGPKKSQNKTKQKGTFRNNWVRLECQVPTENILEDQLGKVGEASLKECQEGSPIDLKCKENL